MCKTTSAFWLSSTPPSSDSRRPVLGTRPSAEYRLRYLTVVDREPVEWPEGWNNRSSVRTNVVIVPDAGDYSVTLSREGFNRIRGPEGDYVAEHWNELVGGE